MNPTRKFLGPLKSNNILSEFANFLLTSVDQICILSPTTTRSTKMDYDYENWLAEMDVDEYPEYEIEDEE